MCCPKGKVLKKPGGLADVKCVRSRRQTTNTLIGTEVTVTEPDNENITKPAVLVKSGIMLPNCHFSFLRIEKVTLKIPDAEEKEESLGEEEIEEPVGRVRLGDYKCGKKKCSKGNVYVDDKPVCDDGWDDNDAEVVCRELGFSGGYATTESKYGDVNLERQSCFDDVRCNGYESSLVDCRHESYDDCGDSEGAGVVCYEPEPEPEPEREPYYDYYGGHSSVPEKKKVLLTSAGHITLPYHQSRYSPMLDSNSTTFNEGEFCISNFIEGFDLSHVPAEDEAIVLACDPCKSKLLCMNIYNVFHSITYGNPEIDDTVGLYSNIILVCDKDGNGKVNLKEFKTKIEEYVEKLFNYLDSDGDGSIDEVQKGESVTNLKLKLFIEIVDEVFAFFDKDQDDMISTEDIGLNPYFDRNGDETISLREWWGMSPINLPAPIYRLYTKLDKDKNEKLSVEEVENFIKGTFYVIDQNEDCSINLEELITTLKESRLPKEYQLAIKLLGDYYFTLADYALTYLATAADVDNDKKITLAEIINMTDFEVLEYLGKVFTNMGIPNMHTAYFLTGQNDYRYENRQAVVEMWLSVLYDFVDSRKYDTVPDNLCGLNK